MTILLVALSVFPSALTGPALTGPALRPLRTERVDRRLVAVRVVRDLDRDGVQDLCLRSFADGRAEIAAISAAHGSALWRADGPEGVVDWTGAPMPGALAPLGDHDRDGLGEIAALWRDTDSAGEQRGVVLALHAGSDGRVLRAIDLVRGPGTQFATMLTSTGDLDGDLLPDLIVLAPARDLYVGRIAAISSASGEELWSTPTDARGDEHGTSIALLRDLDTDGLVDHALVVGNAIEILSGRDGRLVKRIESAVFDVYEDAAGDSAASADTPTESGDGTAIAADPAAPRNRLGSALDALQEAVSALRSAASAPGAYTEPASDAASAIRDLGPRRWLANGSLVVMGDIDGDAVLDLFVPQRVSIGHATSSALVSVGKASLLGRRELPAWSLEICSAGFRAAGDFDGDKRIDILCADAGWNLPGAERSGGVDVGAVRVLSGADGSAVRTWHGGRTLARLGLFTAIAGDVDRDGVTDVWMSGVDTSSRPHEVLGLASGATGAFLRWIDIGRLAIESRP